MIEKGKCCQHTAMCQASGCGITTCSPAAEGDCLVAVVFLKYPNKYICCLKTAKQWPHKRKQVPEVICTLEVICYLLLLHCVFPVQFLGFILGAVSQVVRVGCCSWYPDICDCCRLLAPFKCSSQHIILSVLPSVEPVLTTELHQQNAEYNSAE